ncbi:MAG: YciI family protein [Candidatus Pedobacter colombiensis]|uniref:YciI family protein n=1 Tax=Candidatus Pedobacter colombiensis TaxID=3121371 RepID=A0AAJ5W4S0_9SPHI|nr:YciI family protein [Pedobacter sp.]WEK17570.1 MAG: YciI family protein [Pedobacter sp.]
MKEFMMIFRQEKQEGAEMPSAEQMQAVMKQWQDWIGGIAAQGKYSGTNRLYSEGKTLKPGNVVIDGPYAEVKEMIGGYLIVKANTLDEAVEMAKSCPNLIYGGNVEVRSVMTIEYDPTSAKFLDPQ